MRYKVQIQPTALNDAAAFVSLVRDDNQEPLAATRWYDGLTDAVSSLEFTPEKFSIIPEQSSFRIALRHFHYHSHRVIFHVDEQNETVHVLRIYHSSRDELRPSEIQTY